ncbi:YncE family protein [Gracilibacillus massiliensis]|uniref:hypothetical protein n=1 Tax=Gracilibacillus massiliensis TaxID=1564956 RepID=UPI00071D2605|nr:hypothetical protein [Gracilibacillus massiliensis]
MNKYIIFLILIFLIGCNEENSLEEDSFGVIYTSAESAKSNFSIFNEKGEEVSNTEIKAQGIFEIEKANQKSFILPVRYSDKLIKIKGGDIEEVKTLDFPLYYEQIGEIEFTIFNSDEKGVREFFTYLIEDNDGSKKLRLKGFPLLMVTNENSEAEVSKAYVFKDHLLEDEDKFSIDVIDLKNGKVIDSFPIPINSAPIDGILIGDYLYVVFQSGEIAKILTDDYKIEKENLEYKNPTHLLVTDNHIIIVKSGEKSKVLFLNKNTLIKEEEYTINHSVLKIKQANEKIYILSQKDNTLYEYEERNLKLLNEFILPEKEELLIQDFITM